MVKPRLHFQQKPGAGAPRGRNPAVGAHLWMPTLGVPPRPPGAHQEAAGAEAGVLGRQSQPRAPRESREPPTSTSSSVSQTGTLSGPFRITLK